MKQIAKTGKWKRTGYT